MDRFQLYAKYYDLLYHDKDYYAEVEYLITLINKYSIRTNVEVLDLGCGTGIHANLFTKHGYKVDGVDISKEMITRAKVAFESNKLLRLYESNINDFTIDKRYDIVTSLFHVISYQNDNIDLIKSFKTAYNHLEKDGLFIFDFWYGPGVLTERPEPRVKILENDFICVERKAQPELHVNDNIVNVNYKISITDKLTASNQIINEKHSMRYFFMNELKYYLENVSFKMLDFFEWMTFEKPNTNSWNVVIVAKKS